MLVRELQWTDFKPATEMYFHLYEERAAGHPIGIPLFAEPPSMADEVDWFAGLYRRCLLGEGFASVAEAEGHAVGLCTIQAHSPRPDSELGGHIGVLGILVDHRFRGQGAGRAMMVHALEAARKRFEIVRLGVFADNEGAKRLYRSLGFQTYGCLSRAVRRAGKYIDEELMSLDMGSWNPPTAAPNR